MPKTSIPFLQCIKDQADQNPFFAVDLPDQQGLVIFNNDTTPQQQIDLLRQLILDLSDHPTIPTIPETSSNTSDADCQVTVEERAQLFNFLQP